MDDKRVTGFPSKDKILDDCELNAALEEARNFTGTFTRRLRLLLLRRREESGLLVGQLTGILGVDSSTYRKWENGAVSQCRNCNIRAIRRFLTGELPLGELGSRYLGEPKVPARFNELETHFRSLLTILSLLEGHPGLQDRLVRGFEEYCENSRLQLVEALVKERRKRS